MSTSAANDLSGIAIIGLAGRFPGAKNVQEFWANLCAGKESITQFTDEELLAAGADPHCLRDANFVRARGILQNAEWFDAGFFGFTPRDAEVTDPQHRVLLECAWEALEDGGHDPQRFHGSIGAFAGASLNTYLIGQILGHQQAIQAFTRAFQVGEYNVLVGNDKDYVASRIAYKFNLRGPAVTVQTACSTSLVAVSQACASLLSFQCDMAVAGGVSISFPQKRGYLYQEGAIASADGHCRAFDAEAKGTVFGEGCGVVLLRRLEDALTGGDHIYAVIKGTALNNDGAGKMSYLAPSIEGQSEVIALAHALADVSADSVSYVEAHGTGTPLGDPIEVAALTQAFRATTKARGFCALGSVKTNIGHLEAAAGVTGLIKVALALEHRLIPPLLHFSKPNPDIDFASSPFQIVTQLQPWENVPLPRRAGVSSFGVGGTNAHAILEEAPPSTPTAGGRPECLLILSARSRAALELSMANLGQWLGARAAEPSESAGTASSGLADVAYTLQVGRRAFKQRCFVVAKDQGQAAQLLAQGGNLKTLSSFDRARAPGVVFLFPGQGSQHVQMAGSIYQSEPVFRQHLDHCCTLLEPKLACDLRTVLYPPSGSESSAQEALKETKLAQPALFSVEYALAQLWKSWGIEPSVLVGHSVGEYVAAALAGVMSVDDALTLVATRAALMQSMPPGGMLAVRGSETEILPLLTGSLALASVNSPKSCVVAGPMGEIELLKRALHQSRIAFKPLATSHAFHSAMMDPVLEPFALALDRCSFSPATKPIVSTLTGRFIAAGDWTERRYWTEQLRRSVRFGDAVAALADEANSILLEVGPGQALTQLASQHPARNKEQLVVPSLPATETGDADGSLLSALGRLWGAGIEPDWEAFHKGERCQRVSLPTYPFERQRYWASNSPAGSVDSELPRSIDAPGKKPLEDLAATPRDLLAPPSSLERIISQQLEMMSQQLEVLEKEQAVPPLSN